MQIFRRVRANLAVLASLALGVFASPALAQKAPVRIAFPNGMNGQICVTMEKAGIAKANGLDAEFTSFQNGPPMMEALAAGSLDIGVTSFMPVVSYGAKAPGDIQVVAMLGHSTYALIVAKDSPIQSDRDLEGKKVGISFGSDSHLDALIWLKSQNLAGKATLINVAPAELTTALNNGAVDAIVIRQPQLARLQMTSGARLIKSWPHYYVAIAKRKFLAENPDVLAKFVTSLRQSILYIAQNKEEAAKWFGAHQRVDPALVMAASKDDENYAVRAIENVDVAVTDKAKMQILQWAADAFEHKMIKTKLDPAALF
jgi:ABC-type nitrate/sulfonate/bicarbonate transport system substrate-binding protein